VIRDPDSRENAELGFSLRQGNQIGRHFADWATFRRLGDFSPIGRPFADWATFRRLGDFSLIGRLFADWATFRRLGDFSLIGRLFADWATFRRLGDFSLIGRLVTLDSFLENHRNSQNFKVLFPRKKLRILTKNG
jgi:hypothetical protein